MVRFADCSVDVAQRRVERDGEPRHLEPQAFDLLAYLLANHDRVVPKTELLDEVWGDQFVSESALTTRIKEIRHALGDNGARQAIVKNFRGRGYRFVAAIDDESDTSSAPARSSSRLAGREADIAGAGALLAASRLVTLVGPGGVGKTTLADELTRNSGGRVLIVRLAEVGAPASVTHAIRRDAGLVDVAPSDDALVAALASLNALVVLDNCEHVLAEVSRIVAEVLSAEGAVTFLATSRERLGVADERVWPVAPLDDSAARQLLLDRARRVQPGFTWHVDDEPGVAEILRVIDRLPLAIEMAAARLPTIGVGELAQVLSSRLDLLRSADRSAVERHQTIDALIGWSESLLGEDEHDLLGTMSVFSGPIPASDIAAVAGIDAAELATGPLAGLVDKSLVVADVSQRPACYRLLETVRASASNRRSPSVDAAHARHVADVVASCDRRLRTRDEAAAAARLHALGAEIRAAHAWAREHDHGIAAELSAALLWYAHERHWTEPALWARTLAAELRDDEVAVLAVSAAVAADASNRGDYGEAQRRAAHAATSSDPRIAGSALDTLCNVGLYTGDLKSAGVHARTLAGLGERVGDDVLRTFGVVGEVLSLGYGGRPDEARKLLDSYTGVNELAPTCAAWIAYVDGELLTDAGRHDEAIDRFDTAIRLGTSVGSHFVVSVAEVSSLAASARSGDVMSALSAFRPLLVEYRQIRSDSHAATAIRNLVEALVRAERFQPAMEILGAVSRSDVKSTYGAESGRLESARSIAVERVGRELVETWITRGAARDLAWALDHAIDVLDAM